MKANYDELIKELYLQSLEGSSSTIYSKLGIPDYKEERIKAYNRTCDKLNSFFPEGERNRIEIEYEGSLTEYGEILCETGFRSGFLCAVALTKLLHMEE